MSAAALLSIPGFTDPFSSLSHLAGAVSCVLLSVPLLKRGLMGPDLDKGSRVFSLLVFAMSAVILLSMSGVYHLLGHEGRGRDVLQRLDHAAIFVLIAGTFTPVHAIMFRGPWRWGMLTFIWLFAALGVTLKTVFFTDTPQWLGMVLYLGMGWVGLLSMFALGRRFGARMVLPLIAGGLVYSAGAAIEWAEPAPLIAGVVRAHEVFHVAVLAGLALHWRFVWLIADGKRGVPATVLTLPADAEKQQAA